MKYSRQAIFGTDKLFAGKHLALAVKKSSMRDDGLEIDPVRDQFEDF